MKLGAKMSMTLEEQKLLAIECGATIASITMRNSKTAFPTQESLNSYTAAVEAKRDVEIASLKQELQAHIDELMFEYCPNEMTPVQIENYYRHHVPNTDL